MSLFALVKSPLNEHVQQLNPCCLLFKSSVSLINFREITTFNDELPLFGWLMLVKFKCLVSSIKSPLSPCKIRNEAPCQSLGIGRSSQALLQGQGGSPEKLGISPGSEHLIAWSKTLQEWPWNCCVVVGHVMFRWPSLLLSINPRVQVLEGARP